MEKSRPKSEFDKPNLCAEYFFFSFITTIIVAVFSSAISPSFWTVLPRYFLFFNFFFLSLSFYFSYRGFSKLRVFLITLEDETPKEQFLIHKVGNKFSLSFYVMHCCLLALISCLTVGAGPEATVFVIYFVSCAAHSVHWRASLTRGDYKHLQHLLYIIAIVLSLLEFIFFIPSVNLLKGSILTFAALILITFCMYVSVRSGYIALPSAGIPVTARKMLPPLVLICMHCLVIEENHLLLRRYPAIVIGMFITFTSFNEVVSITSSVLCFVFYVLNATKIIVLFKPEQITDEEMDLNASF